MSDPADIDLAALTPAIRAAFEAERPALEADVAMLAEHNRRLEHLVTEFRQALYGKRSEKLSEDERQLAFEDLEGECPIFCVRVCRSMLRGKDSVDHGEEDRRRDIGRVAEGLRGA